APGVLDLNSGFVGVRPVDTVGLLEGSGTVNLGQDSSVLTIRSDNTDRIFSGVLIGGGGLTKAGTGRLTLSGTAANSYSGTTRLSGGTLAAAKDGALGSGLLFLLDGTQLQSSRPGGATLTNSNVDFSGSVTLGSSQSAENQALHFQTGDVVLLGN